MKMKSCRIFAPLVMTWLFTSVVAAQGLDPVRTQEGLVQGTMHDGIAVYKGLPFAAPPVGDLRWRAPQPAPAWKGIRKADKFAPACMQAVMVNASLGMDPMETSEDCLYLNIWTPAKSPKEALPVMVWIHGGAFSMGGTAIGQYDGTNLARKGVVLVTIAYRLGVFGFTAHPELTKEQGGHSGNYGLLDQIAAFKWIQRNIAAFGGDPKRVTIFGESAGGISVSMLAASPLAQGLFQGAISESGGNFGPARRANEGGENMVSLAAAEKLGAAFLARLGANSIAEARKKSADEVLKHAPRGLTGSWPIFDGYVLVGDQYELYEAGRFNGTPVLIGTNADEGGPFVQNITAEAYRANIRAGYEEYADKVLAAYPGNTDAEALRSSRDIFRETAFAWPTWAWARLQAKSGKGPVYVYYFTHRPPYPDTPMFKDWGAAHGAEIAFVFGNFTPTMPARAVDRAISEELSSYWVQFAKTGNPNGKGLPEWPAFTNENPRVMELGDRSHPIAVPNLEKLQVWEGYYAWRRSQAGTGIASSAAAAAH